MRTRIPAIARKELLHIVRDWRTLGLAFGLPMILTLLFGYGITFDIKHLKLAVADEDQTKISRAFIQKFTAGEYFVLTAVAATAEELPRYLENGGAQVALAIPKDFARRVEQGRAQTIQVLLDGSESNTATIAGAYVEAIVADYTMSLVRDLMIHRGLSPEGVPPVAAVARVWFNPRLDSPTTIVPGLIAVTIVLMAGLLTSLTVVRERELGSLESLFATPVRKQEILIGKLLPYLGITMIDTVLIALLGVAVFDVPFRGSVVLFGLTGLAFTFAGLAIGLVASVVASSQLFANQIVVLSTMLPSMLLSGFMFPIESMPGWVQVITYAVPARYFVALARGIMLKAQPWPALAHSTWLLLVVGAVLFALANARFRKKL